MAERFAVVAELVMRFLFGATQPRQPMVRQRAAGAAHPAPGPTPDPPPHGAPAVPTDPETLAP